MSTTKTVLGGLAVAALTATTALVGAAAPANAGGSTVIKTGVPAGGSTVIKTGVPTAIGFTVIRHASASDLPQMGVLQQWHPNWTRQGLTQVAGSYTQLKAAGAMYLVKRGDRTPLNKSMAGVYVPAGYWLGKVSAGTRNIIYVTNGGPRGVARKINAGDWYFALCPASKNGKQCYAS